MIVHPSPHKPWQVKYVSAACTLRRPDLVELEENPQLGPITLLQDAANITVPALLAQHGVARGLADELTDCPDCVVAVLARLIVMRCEELSEMLSAYRFSLQRPTPDPPANLRDDPF